MVDPAPITVQRDPSRCSACGEKFPGWYPPNKVIHGEDGQKWHPDCLPVNFRQCACCEVAFEGLTAWFCASCKKGEADGPPDPAGFEDGFCQNH